ncbi:hypothetical protein DV737_g3547, partial [Chaetothyriales sp. CBS 132003]
MDSLALPPRESVAERALRPNTIHLPPPQTWTLYYCTALTRLPPNVASPSGSPFRGRVLPGHDVLTDVRQRGVFGAAAAAISVAAMSAATTLKSPTHAYAHARKHSSSSRPSRPSTTPRSPPGPDSIPVDSATGHHSRQNWVFPDYSAASNGPNSPRPVPPEANPNFDAFRRQSEKGSDRFHLGS